MSYSQDQYQAAMRGARKILDEMVDDPKCGTRRIGPGRNELIKDRIVVYGEFDLGELITAALDAAHATT